MVKIAKKCAVEECERKAEARDWCLVHYKRWKKHGDPLVTLRPRRKTVEICIIDDCEKKVIAREMCSTHYQRWLHHGDPSVKLTNHGEVDGCSVEGCENPHQAKGFCDMHYRRWKAFGDPLEQRVLYGEGKEARLLEKRNIDENGCWRFTGYVEPRGYAKIWDEDIREKQYAHIVAYELWIGPIPEGLQIDHLCRVRDCFNPDHLEAVTHRENLLRGDTVVALNAVKTHCIHGHFFDESNTYIDKYGKRHCRKCRAATEQKRRDRQHEER